MKLPSEQILREYTHFIKLKPGFQDEVDLMLAQEAKLSSLPEWRKYVVILFDEIKVKSSLIYDKYSAQVIGFVNLGELNDSLRNMERSNDECKKQDVVATHMLRRASISKV